MDTKTARAKMMEEVAKLEAEGKNEHADKLRLVAEFFTNPDFRKSLSDYIWQLGQ